MKLADQYLKIVKWSEEDQVYVGYCPGLMLGGVHGDDEVAVYQELCEVVGEWLQIHTQENLPLPPILLAYQEIEAKVANSTSIS